MKIQRSVITFLSLLMILSFQSCSHMRGKTSAKPAVHPDLAAHSAEFAQEVIRIGDRIHTAVGYGLANSIMIEGDTGIIIVDTMESQETANRVMKEFRKITRKPVKAIIYTHSHSDHTFGARAFAENSSPDIFSHESTLAMLDELASTTREITYRRAVRQFGTCLNEGDLINAGIGPFLDFNDKSTIGLLRPTKTFSGEVMNLVIAGVPMQLIHAPGETDDQIVVWLPDEKALLCADDYYKSFPNLYAIRGTRHRDAMKWVRSIDAMRSLDPEFLVPSHTRPLTERDVIQETLMNYRDAIQYVHDQTIRGINRGLSPDELAETIRLPAHLASKPYLQEYYGTVAWSVRGIYDGYLGWFDEGPSKLFPLSRKELSERMINLAGGREALLGKAEDSYDLGDPKWSLVLVEHLLITDPADKRARELKTHCMVRLAEQTNTATARNYLLTQVRELEGSVSIGKRKIKEAEVVQDIPLKAIFDAMSVSLDPEKSQDIDKIVAFHFPDTGQAFTLHVRHGVAEVRPFESEKPDLIVETSSLIWKEIAAGLRNPAISLAKGDVKIKGGTLDLVRFMGLFDRP